MIVVDASAAVAALLNAGRARELALHEQLHAPHLIDVEVVSALRRAVATERVPAETASQAIRTWQQLGVVRYAGTPLLARIWQLRHNLSSYDACYVALAEALDCALVTADSRLSRAPGLVCAVDVVPS